MPLSLPRPYTGQHRIKADRPVWDLIRMRRVDVAATAPAPDSTTKPDPTGKG